MRAIHLLPLALAACAADEPTLTDHDGFDDTAADGKADVSTASARTVHRFTDKSLYPEGGAFDPTDRAFYVGSLEHGNITRVAADGTESIFYAGTGEDERYTLGMQVDPDRGQLWVCTTKDSIGRIWIFDLATKQRVADIDLTRSGNAEAACNDVLLDGESALVSDRENHHIYRIDATHNVSVWADNPLLGGALVSLNSMVFTPDRSAVLTAVYLAPSLIRVSVANPLDVREVELEGDMFMDGFNVLNGPDDLMMHGNQLIIAFGSSIKRVTPSTPDWFTATVRSTRTIGGVTALATDGDTLWGINGQSVRYLLGVPPAPFQIFEIDTRKLR